MQRITVQPFMMIGLSIRTTNENGRAAREIASLCNEFLTKSLSKQIPNKINDDIYLLYTDHDCDHTQPYTASLGGKVSTLDKMPNGMIGRVFEGGA